MISVLFSSFSFSKTKNTFLTLRDVWNEECYVTSSCGASRTLLAAFVRVLFLFLFLVIVRNSDWYTDKQSDRQTHLFHPAVNILVINVINLVYELMVPDNQSVCPLSLILSSQLTGWLSSICDNLRFRYNAVLNKLFNKHYWFEVHVCKDY